MNLCLAFVLLAQRVTSLQMGQLPACSRILGMVPPLFVWNKVEVLSFHEAYAARKSASDHPSVAPYHH